MAGLVTPRQGEMLAYHFECTNTPPPGWLMSRVQEEGQVATDALQETGEARRVAFEACERGQARHRDRALMRLPRPGEFSQLEWDIEPLLKKANGCSLGLQACRTITQQHSEG